ncbi:MAG TPA: hypothetical protein VGK59_23825 [Ohtaekwangia sp.]
MNKLQESLIKPDEKVYKWYELSADRQQVVALVHAKAFKCSPKKMLTLFEIGRPTIVFGPQHNYCRIHPESVDVMKVITKQYL